MFAKINKCDFSGDLCVDRRTNTKGICKLLPQCPSAIANLRKGIYPTSCGFSGREIIICCEEIESATTTTMRSSSKTEKPTKVTTSKRRTPGEISDKSKS